MRSFSALGFPPEEPVKGLFHPPDIDTERNVRYKKSARMSDAEGSTAPQSTTAVETGGQPTVDNVLLMASAATVMAIDEQQTVAITKDDGEPNPKKAKLSGGGGDVIGRGGVGSGGGFGDKQTALDKLEHRLGGILCCAVCLDLPRSAIYQVSASIFLNRTIIVFVVVCRGRRGGGGTTS